MKRTIDNLHPINVISLQMEPAAGAFLVGGTVRDLLLGRDTADIDLAVTGDAGAFAKKAALALGGTAFALDAERGVYRVLAGRPERHRVDVAPLKGSVEDDLAARDFTVNAMAIPLPLSPGGRPVLDEAAVVDPFGGRADMAARVVRVLGKDALAADPVRMLRAFRLALTLGFRIESGTLGFIRELAPAVASASAERVRDELFGMLDAHGSAGAFRAMAGAGLLQEVIPEVRPMVGLPQGEPHAFDLMEHSLKAMGYAESVMEDAGRYFGDSAGRVREFLDARLPGGPTMAGLVKLCALLHDVGKPARMKREGDRIRFIGHDEEGARVNAEVAARLRMSAAAEKTLSVVTAGHMRPLHLSFDAPSARAVYRYVRDMGECLPASLIVALADAMATRERPDSISTDVEGLAGYLAGYYYGEFSAAKEKPLVTGRDLIEVFGLKPGPAFSRILGEVAEKRAEGSFTDREGALDYVRENLARLTG